MSRFLFLQSWLLIFCLAFSTCLAGPAPWVIRISCGSRVNVRTLPTNTLWYKDFAYTGGIPTNSTAKVYVAPPLKTLRYFPLSEGPNNCYNIKKVPRGRYSVRVFFGLVAHHDPDPNFDNEPLFDISVEGTQIYSLQSGWSNHEDQVFTEAQVFLTDGTASICFHSTGHGDPAILSIEILEVADRAYYFGPEWGEGVILRTVTRLSCGNGKSKFDVDYSGDRWGGDRLWSRMTTFGQSSDKAISTENSIKKASNAPNFYPEALYQTALVSTDSQLDLAYTMDVDPHKNYSIWLHFAEIDVSVTDVGQRIFDILINGDVIFDEVDITKMSGDRYTALVLNTTVPVNGRTLTITLNPKEGSHAIINAIEVFEVITAEPKTLLEEVRALQALKSALGLPLRFGWNGDPCVPQQHPWSGADCQFDRTSSKWVIDGLDLSYNFFNGSIPDSIGQLTSVRRLNLNGNSLSGRVPAALGERLLHGASFNFTDNAGLCGMPGLPTCGPHLSAGAKIGIAFGASVAFLLMVICLMCWWKRRQNILRAQQIAARGAPYAKARIQTAHDIQMTRHHNHGYARTAAENGPSLLS
ncbi:receptor-like protein 4 isoform X4 [Hevea brasiliensis]|uniref:receptor-like protein 4 isoform X4 n=1 Tax=Hevea brasiliensis TaxID=3981 RepID=UPI0025F95AD9|nr:receptor-like protein 4 isoform X4 [Hevea brasiliensis]